jgi:hypothetical protein
VVAVRTITLAKRLKAADWWPAATTVFNQWAHFSRSVGDGILPFTGWLAHCPCSDEALSSPLSPLQMHSPSPVATADTHPLPASLLIVFGCSGGFILASVGQIQGG